MSGEEEDDSWDALRRISEEQQQRHNAAETIMENQVAELREISAYFARSSSLPDEAATKDRKTYEYRMTCLLLLETCNSLWDIVPLSAALDHVHEHPPPVSPPGLLENASPAPEDFVAFDEAIPFEAGSDEWAFVILLAYKPHNTVYNGRLALLRPEQSPLDACIENGIVCARCLKPGTEVHPEKLMQCSRCKVVRYCSKKCQAEHWTDGGHKKRCRAGRLKEDPEKSDGSTRRHWYEEEMNPCWIFIKCHSYPSYESMIGINNGYLGPGIEYTDEMHQRFEKAYEYIGKNSFKVYGRELGEYLHRLGGKRYMEAGELVFTQVINSFPRDGIGSPEIAEILARRLLSFSWNGIGGWEG